jgi:hypothetical protein
MDAEIEKKICEAYQGGKYTRNQISEMFGITQKTITTVIRRNNMPLKSEIRTRPQSSGPIIRNIISYPKLYTILKTLAFWCGNRRRTNYEILKRINSITNMLDSDLIHRFETQIPNHYKDGILVQEGRQIYGQLME